MTLFPNFQDENRFLRQQIVSLQKQLGRYSLTPQQLEELRSLGYTRDLDHLDEFHKIETFTLDDLEYGMIIRFYEGVLVKQQDIKAYVASIVKSKILEEIKKLSAPKKPCYSFQWREGEIKNCVDCPLVRVIGDFHPLTYVCNLKGRVYPPYIKPSDCPLKEI